MLQAFWLLDFSNPYITGSPLQIKKDQSHQGSPGVYPPPSPALKHTGTCPPSPTGAWSWSSCTDTARRPAERGLGLSWPSRGGHDIRVCSGQLPPPQPLPPPCQGPQSHIGVGPRVPTYLHSWGPSKGPPGDPGCLGRGWLFAGWGWDKEKGAQDRPVGPNHGP